MKRFLPFLPFIVLTTILFGGWTLLHATGAVNPIILPSPKMVFGTMVSQAPIMFRHSLVTLGSSVAGLLIALAASLCLVSGFFFWPSFKSASYPYAIALKATPLVAIAPFIVFLFGSGMESKFAMSAIVAFFPILVSFWDGIERTPQDLRDTFRLLGANRAQEFMLLRMPSAIPDLFSGLKIGATLAVVGTVIAEFTGASAGLGFAIKSASYYLRTEIVFAALAYLVAGSLGLFGCVVGLERIVRNRMRS